MFLVQNRHRNICRECAAEDPRIERPSDSACAGPGRGGKKKEKKKEKKAKTPGEKQCGFIDCVPRNGRMFVADAQCMCDRSYEEDDAEDDRPGDTGYETRDLLKLLSLFLRVHRDRGRARPDPRVPITTRNNTNLSCFLLGDFRQ